MKKLRSGVLFRTTSWLDGKPVRVVIARGNRKTGRNMVGVSFHPTGKDDSTVCGDCPERPANGGRCYVDARGITARARHRRKAVLPDGVPIRLGTWGDPAAVSTSEIRRLIEGRRWTGYTHQWRKAPALRGICMASVGSEAEAREAQAAGWRTARILSVVGWDNGGPIYEPTVAGEIVCPAQTHVDMTCEKCMLCDGTRRERRPTGVVANVAFRAHGGRVKGIRKRAADALRKIGKKV